MSDTKKIKIQRALISVSDKTGLEKLCQPLVANGVELLSSGGTAKFLREKGFPVKDVAEFTGAPEMLDGRIKTLHPKVHGGILAIRDNSTHMKEMKEQSYETIDLVVVNLYPFEEASTKDGMAFSDVIEQIDIGGPTMLRSAAKNFPYVTVLIDPSQYDGFVQEINGNSGHTTYEFRKAAAKSVFERTACYDSAIVEYLNEKEKAESAPTKLPIGLAQKWSLRYGENPHQWAGFYLPVRARGKSILDRVLQGKELSYNNLMDVHAALELISDFDRGYTVGIFKHTNPCGVGVSGSSLLEAYQRALECDPVSAFGGIVVFSHPVDADAASECVKTFTEIVIAPKFDSGAKEVFSAKKNLRLLEVDPNTYTPHRSANEIRRIADGYLVQQRDLSIENLSQCKVVTKRQPSKDELAAMTLGWKVAKHVKSNAIVLSNSYQTVGIGAGQMSRVDSSKIAAMKAIEGKIKGSVLSSDAFFPFRDGVDEAARHGITAVVQPGGSIRDEEVIQAANDNEMAMIFTGIRHFRH